MDTTPAEPAPTGKDVPAILDIGISLDGFVATNDQDPAEIHDWMFGRKTEADDAFARDIMDRGSVIMGRNTFNVCYDGKAWDGPAWPVPMFVVTHEEREPLDWDGVPYTFISGLEEALTAAKEASDGRPVQIMGGGKLAAAYMASGLLDEVRIHIAPVLMGSGVPLFSAETPGTGPGQVTAFDVVSSVQTPAATHLILKPRNN